MFIYNFLVLLWLDGVINIIHVSKQYLTKSRSHSLMINVILQCSIAIQILSAYNIIR